MPIMPSALYCLWFNCLTRHFQNIYVQACLLLFKSHPWAALWTGSECFENIFAWLLFKYLDIFVQMSGRSCVIYRLQFNSMSGGSEGFSTDIDAREVCHIATGLQVPCKCNAAIQAAHNNSDSTRQWNCTWVLQDVCRSWTCAIQGEAACGRAWLPPGPLKVLKCKGR